MVDQRRLKKIVQADADKSLVKRDLPQLATAFMTHWLRFWSDAENGYGAYEASREHADDASIALASQYRDGWLSLLGAFIERGRQSGDELLAYYGSEWDGSARAPTTCGEYAWWSWTELERLSTRMMAQYLAHDMGIVDSDGDLQDSFGGCASLWQAVLEMTEEFKRLHANVPKISR